MSETTTVEPRPRGRRQKLTGRVVSDSMNKTVVVAVENRLTHALYKRHVKRTAKYYAHDEANECGVGDQVEIVASRPLSKLKRWRVRRVLQKAEG